MDSETQILGFGLLEGGGIEIGYVRVPQDVKKNGLIHSHSLSIPRGSDYDDELDEVMEALASLLSDALEDDELAEPVDLTEDDDEEQEEEED